MHVEAKKSINRSKSEVLAEIRKSGNLENYHPFCAENETDKWPGIGSIAVSYTHLTLPTT